MVIFSPPGGQVGSDPGQFVRPTGITLDAGGTVYVAEHGNNRVQAFRLLPPFDSSPPHRT
jgi:NHL repeat